MNRIIGHSLPGLSNPGLQISAAMPYPQSILGGDGLGVWAIWHRLGKRAPQIEDVSADPLSSNDSNVN